MFYVNEELAIADWEIRFSFARSSGPGGQNVNKVNSKALLRWSPALSALPRPVVERFIARFASRLTTEGELLLTSDEFRDQRRNQENCLDKLRDMLLEVAKPPKPRKKTRPGRGVKERRKLSKRNQSEKKKSRSGKNWD